MVAFAKPNLKTHTRCGSAKDSGHRFYSPEISRWLSRDPITERGGLNLYGFVQNDAIGRVDPDGRGFQFGTGVILQDPVEQDLGRFVRVGAYRVNRCDIAILAGHGRYHPAVIEVAEGDEGCAYGSSYGCFTGGGIALAADGDFDPEEEFPEEYHHIKRIVFPRVDAPEIPEAPEQPTFGILEGPFVERVLGAFSAAVDQISELCDEPCCCNKVHIYVECYLHPAEPPLGGHICEMEVEVTCQ